MAPEPDPLGRAMDDMLRFTRRALDTAVDVVDRGVQAVQPAVDRAVTAIWPSVERASRAARPLADDVSKWTREFSATFLRVSEEAADAAVVTLRPIVARMAGGVERVARKVRKRSENT